MATDVAMILSRRWKMSAFSPVKGVQTVRIELLGFDIQRPVNFEWNVRGV